MYSQSLINDFSAGSGYRLLYDFMITMDGVGDQDARDAQRHVILLTSDLVSCGYETLSVTTSEPGPFNPGFHMPAPLNGGIYMYKYTCVYLYTRIDELPVINARLCDC